MTWFQEEQPTMKSYGEAANFETIAAAAARSVAMFGVVTAIGAALAGCGGSSSGRVGPSPSNPTGPTAQSQVGTAVFHVNVASGQVTVSPVMGQTTSQAISSHAFLMELPSVLTAVSC
jgi:hypothetical protein